MDHNLTLLMEQVPTPLFLICKNGRTLHINAAGRMLLGVANDSSFNQSLFTLLSIEKGKMRNLIATSSEVSLSQGYRGTLRKLHQSRAFNVMVSWQPITLDDGIVYLVNVVDVSRFVEREKELITQASTDELTGTSNRRQFHNRLSREIRRAKRYKHPVSIILFDIDHFKEVNDTYGHDIGDKFLVELSKALQPILRNCDLLARLGGDEFAIIMPETSYIDAQVVASRICKIAKGTTVIAQNEKISVTLSVGVASVNGAAISTQQLIKEADKALYVAKRSGRDQVEVANIF